MRRPICASPRRIRSLITRSVRAALEPLESRVLLSTTILGGGNLQFYQAPSLVATGIKNTFKARGISSPFANTPLTMRYIYNREIYSIDGNGTDLSFNARGNLVNMKSTSTTILFSQIKNPQITSRIDSVTTLGGWKPFAPNSPVTQYTQFGNIIYIFKLYSGKTVHLNPGSVSINNAGAIVGTPSGFGRSAPIAFGALTQSQQTGIKRLLPAGRTIPINADINVESFDGQPFFTYLVSGTLADHTLLRINQSGAGTDLSVPTITTLESVPDQPAIDSITRQFQQRGITLPPSLPVVRWVDPFGNVVYTASLTDSNGNDVVAGSDVNGNPAVPSDGTIREFLEALQNAIYGPCCCSNLCHATLLKDAYDFVISRDTVDQFAVSQGFAIDLANIPANAANGLQNAASENSFSSFIPSTLVYPGNKFNTEAFSAPEHIATGKTTWLNVNVSGTFIPPVISSQTTFGNVNSTALAEFNKIFPALHVAPLSSNAPVLLQINPFGTATYFAPLGPNNQLIGVNVNGHPFGNFDLPINAMPPDTQQDFFNNQQAADGNLGTASTNTVDIRISGNNADYTTHLSSPGASVSETLRDDGTPIDLPTRTTEAFSITPSAVQNAIHAAFSGTISGNTSVTKITQLNGPDLYTVRLKDNVGNVFRLTRDQNGVPTEPPLEFDNVDGILPSFISNSSVQFDQLSSGLQDALDNIGANFSVGAFDPATTVHLGNQYGQRLSSVQASLSTGVLVTFTVGRPQVLVSDAALNDIETIEENVTLGDTSSNVRNEFNVLAGAPLSSSTIITETTDPNDNIAFVLDRPRSSGARTTTIEVAQNGLPTNTNEGSPVQYAFNTFPLSFRSTFLANKPADTALTATSATPVYISDINDSIYYTIHFAAGLIFTENAQGQPANLPTQSATTLDQIPTLSLNSVLSQIAIGDPGTTVPTDQVINVYNEAGGTIIFRALLSDGKSFATDQSGGADVPSASDFRLPFATAINSTTTFGAITDPLITAYANNFAQASGFNSFASNSTVTVASNLGPPVYTLTMLNSSNNLQSPLTLVDINNIVYPLGPTGTTLPFSLVPTPLQTPATKNAPLGATIGPSQTFRLVTNGKQIFFTTPFTSSNGVVEDTVTATGRSAHLPLGLVKNFDKTPAATQNQFSAQAKQNGVTGKISPHLSVTQYSFDNNVQLFTASLPAGSRTLPLVVEEDPAGTIAGALQQGAVAILLANISKGSNRGNTAAPVFVQPLSKPGAQKTSANILQIFVRPRVVGPFDG